jgi:signal peptidase I
MEKTLMAGETFIVTKISNFERNDLVVFDIYSNNYQLPPDEETGQHQKHWEKRIYRLIAFSGDTLQIKNGDIFVNGKSFPFPEQGMRDYEILSDKRIPALDEKEIYEVNMRREDSGFRYTTALTNEEVKAFENMCDIISVKRYISNHNDISIPMAVSASGLKWTVDNYGPLRIPAPGETLNVDSANFLLFRNIPGIRKGSFTVREKLYFVMGDNRHRSADSRYEGFISHSKMYGVVK